MDNDFSKTNESAENNVEKESSLAALIFHELPAACFGLIGCLIKSYTIYLPARINRWRYERRMAKKHRHPKSHI